MGGKLVVLACLVLLLACATPAYAFGAGNIASIAKIEGSNYRHGDIEDMLATVAHLKGYKWTSMMIKRVYFGNWLRDYSQAVDVGTLKGVQANAIRILVWILAFISFGYATREFEVTEERLGVYRPEEHIDNPEDYADNVDARSFDPRLRGPVRPEELAVDPETGMKNYISNDRGDWATSSGYVRYSFVRSIHFGRTFTSGAGNTKGREQDLFEALRCLGQGLHCLEDFGAHTNYCELVLRELGFHNVFPHVGLATEMTLQGRRVFPLVTGTFGGVDFLHSVLGEAGDHVTQAEVSEVDQMKDNMAGASQQNTSRSFDAQQQASGLTDLLSKVPGCGDFCQQAVQLQHASNAQAAENAARGINDSARDPPPDIHFQQPMMPSDAPPAYDTHIPQPAFDQKPSHGFVPPGTADLHPGGYATSGSQSFPPPPGYGMQNEQQPIMSGGVGGAPPTFPGPPGAESQSQQQSTSAQSQQQSSGALGNIDLQATVNGIYPILEFRDNVVRAISSVFEKIPGLEKLIETISEKITLFIMGLLAPYIIPIVNAASAQLKTGSSTVVKASAQHQYAPWNDPNCTAPTHSMLSKDHFSNTLNNPAGKVATAILQYAAPRVVYAWEHPGVPVEQVLDDIVGPAGAFHHPALRRHDREIHQKMFGAVQSWVDSLPDRGHSLNEKLSSESVRKGHNHTAGAGGILGSGESSLPSFSGAGQHENANVMNLGGIPGMGGHGSSSSGLGQFAGKLFSGLGGQSGGQGGGLGKLVGSALGSREIDERGEFNYGSVAPDTAQEGYSHAGQHLAPTYGAFGQEGAQSTYEAMQHRRSVSPYPEQGGYEPPPMGQRQFGYEHQAPQGSGYEYGGGGAYQPQEGYGGQSGYGGEYRQQSEYGGGYAQQGGYRSEYGEQGSYGGGYSQYVPPGGHQGDYGAYPQ